MKQYIFAKRRQDAHRQLETAVYALAESLNISPPEMSPRSRQPKIARLKRDENLGVFLAQVGEAINGVQTAVLEQAEGYLNESEILAIPGLTKTSRDAIENHFEALAAAGEEV